MIHVESSLMREICSSKCLNKKKNRKITSNCLTDVTQKFGETITNQIQTES